MVKLAVAGSFFGLLSMVLGGPIEAQQQQLFKIKAKAINGPTRFDGLYFSLYSTGPESNFITATAENDAAGYGYYAKDKTITVFEMGGHRFPESISLDYGPKVHSTAPKGYHNLYFSLGLETSGFSKTTSGQTIEFKNKHFPDFAAFAICDSNTRIRKSVYHKGPAVFWRNKDTPANSTCADIELVHD